jgi:hypothetical protein
VPTKPGLLIRVTPAARITQPATGDSTGNHIEDDCDDTEDENCVAPVDIVIDNMVRTRSAHRDSHCSAWPNGPRSSNSCTAALLMPRWAWPARCCRQSHSPSERRVRWIEPEDDPCPREAGPNDGVHFITPRQSSTKSHSDSISDHARPWDFERQQLRSQCSEPAPRSSTKKSATWRCSLQAVGPYKNVGGIALLFTVLAIACLRRTLRRFGSTTIRPPNRTG